jgi:ribosome recycling factor
MLSAMLLTRRCCVPLVAASSRAAKRTFVTTQLASSRATPFANAVRVSSRSPLAYCSSEVRFKSKKAKKDKKEANANAAADTASEDEGDAEIDLDECKAGMVEVLTKFNEELKKVRAGRLQPDFLDHLWVQVVNAEEPAQLSEVAQISIKSPRLAVVTCFDPANVKPTQLAIRSAPLGLNPELQPNDTLHIKIPAETKESRQKLVKLAHDLSEKAKRKIAEQRRKDVKMARGLKGASGVSKDDIARYEKEISTLHDNAVSKVVKLFATKEKELLSS